MRSFNTAGPVNPTDHYLIAPLSRIDLDDVLGLVRDKKYFVLHAPRQTGKMSALLALAEVLNRRGRPQRFPHSVVLCGMRDLRDYRMGAVSPETARKVAASSLVVRVRPATN